MSAAVIQSTIDKLSTLLSFIFSWVILLSIGVIVSGKFLANVLPMRGISKTYFRISLFIFRLEAQNDEVILGMSGFILTFSVIASVGGITLYHFLVEHLGIDPGQFNVLCFASALVTVAWSSTLWLLTANRISSTIDPQQSQAMLKRVEEKIEQRERTRRT